MWGKSLPSFSAQPICSQTLTMADFKQIFSLRSNSPWIVSDELMRKYSYKKLISGGLGLRLDLARLDLSWDIWVLEQGCTWSEGFIKQISVREEERSFSEEESGLWWPHAPNRWPIFTFTANVTIWLEDQNSISYTFPPAKMSTLPEAALQCPADILHD